MELMVKQENAVWLLAEELQEQEPKWDLVRERKYQPKKFKDVTNNLLEQNILNIDRGLMTRFLISLTWEKSSREIMTQDGGLGTYHKDTQARQCPQGQDQMGIKRFPRQTERILANWFSCFHKTWISDELPNGSQTGMGSFSHWPQNSIPSKTILKYEPWCCVSITTRSRSSTMYCC